MEESEALTLLSTLVPFALIVFIIAVGVVLLNQQFRKNLYKQQLEQEALKSQHQRELLRTSIEAQEGERQRIARDLHDELGAALSIGRMQLVQLERQETIDPARLTSIRELMETALQTTRRISHELMPLQLEKLGLTQGLHALATKAEEAGNVTIDVAVADNLDTLPRPIELGIYRMYSELINNTLKHAQASTIEISLLRESNELFCRYADDGKGLPPESTDSGIGLQSLEGRVNSLQGSLTYGNRDGGGFFARMKLPVHIAP